MRPTARFDVVAFDADDTLWHNERLFIEAQARFRDLLRQYHSAEWIAQRLYQTEMRNLAHFGYGIKAFALSMIETAVELTESRISGRDIQTIIDTAKAMIAAEVELIDHTAATVAHLAERHALMVITKGDLRDQEAKIQKSGLAAHFKFIEIVSDKRAETYRGLLMRHRIRPERFVMIGNSLRSDILPVLEIGGTAVYVPHELTWAHEAADQPEAGRPGYYELAHLGLVPKLLADLEAAG